MKFPALAIAFSLAGGILAGGVLAARVPHALPLCLIGAAILLPAGFLLLAGRLDVLAGAASLLVCCLLGAAAAQLEPLETPSDHITRLLAAKSIDLTVPLRWRGRLRADPLRLPWGVRYEMDLEQVESAGRWMPVAGGLRVSRFFDERQGQDAAPPTADLADRVDDQAGGQASLRAGDRIEVLVRAAPARNFADPGSFDYRTFLARQQIDLTGFLRNAALLTPLPGSAPTFANRLARMRGRLLNEVNEMLADNPGRAAVARAMLLGDRSFLDSEQIEIFQNTGAYHVLVLAGLHVGILAVALLWIGRKLRFSLLSRTLFTIAALSAYVAVVEDRPPILRASLMAAIYLLARLQFRRTALLNIIGLAVVAILIVRPSELADPSFLLSFLAAFAIAGVAAPLLERTAERYRRALNHLGDVTRDHVHPPRVAQFRLDLRTLANWLTQQLPKPFSHLGPSLVTAPCRAAFRFWELIAISLAIQIGMLPLMAQYFHRISPVGVAANIPAVLLTSLIVPFGFFSLGIGLFWHRMGIVLGRLLSTAIGALITSVGWFGRMSWASYRVPSPPVLLLAAFFVGSALLAVAILLDWKWPTWTLSGAVAIFAALIALYPFSPRLLPGRLEVTVLDVGQGDSIFVAFPDGRTMLVDGGGLPGGFYVHGNRPGIDIGEDVVSPFLWSRGLKRIDVVALTHAHEDHLGGLPAVLRNFRVGELWVGRDVDSTAYRGLIADAHERGVPVIHRVGGEAFNWDVTHMRVLWPQNDDAVKAASNDDSLVLKLEDGHERFLLAGDIERLVERELLDPGTGQADDLPADFLKVPHHGSKTSSTQPFLDAVHPHFAVISVGESNAFGHPNAEVVDRISAEGARLFRTDRDGAITAVTNGSSMDVHSFLNPH